MSGGRSAIYEGWVQHRRHHPLPHAFRYRVFLLYLDLSELDSVFSGRWLWSLDKANVAQFRRRDYFGDPAIALDSAVRSEVAKRLQRPITGPIRLLTHARYFGVTMNPVSFYYGFLPDGETLDWILAEITNTPWGERHSYLLPVNGSTATAAGLQWTFDKAFHVSPFMAMARRYQWRLQPPDATLRVHMEVLDGERREFDATLTLERRPLAANTLASCLLRFPFMTARVALAIYWQAAKLFWKRIPFHNHPGSLTE